MALARITSGIQQAVLANARMAPATTMGSGREAFSRFFGTGYLDKNDVTERILSSVKHFEKVDENKVRRVPCVFFLC